WASKRASKATARCSERCPDRRKIHERSWRSPSSHRDAVHDYFRSRYNTPASRPSQTSRQSHRRLRLHRRRRGAALVCQGKRTVRKARARRAPGRHGHRLGVPARADRARSGNRFALRLRPGAGGASGRRYDSSFRGHRRLCLQSFHRAGNLQPRASQRQEAGRQPLRRHVGLRLALKKWGLNPERDLNILQVGTTQDTLRAMQTRLIDAGVLSGTASLLARKAGFRELADLADLGLHYPMAPLGTTKSYLQRNPALVKDFMLAYIEAIREFKRDKAGALRVLRKYTRNDDAEVLADSYDNYAGKYLALPIPPVDAIRTILAEIASTTPAAKTAEPEQFVAYKLAREIEASGFVKRLYAGEGQESR